MERSGRRDFLRFGAGAATLGLLPASIRRALALPASARTGTIEDVEHIVVFMQENRSFDHYFGHLSGVRGYNDRFPVLRANGKSVWNQPRKGDPAKEVLPFRLQTQTTSAECVLDLDHTWYPTHAAIAGGRNDRWPDNKTDMTMGYYTREDIPFHYALADAFTICDNYFCSTPTQTHPNRMYLMTGMVDHAATGGGPLLDNIDYVDRDFLKGSQWMVPPPFSWTTYPERLEAAGITWQVYQQGLSPSDAFNGNYGTNVLMNFGPFIHAPRDSGLQKRAMTARTLHDLAQDVVKGRLPQVSWLLPPAAYSEHPKYTPGYGAAYIARVLDALTADPEVWSKTVLLLMYDENDGYFDHVVPPQPPTPVLPGKSTVSTDGEIHDRTGPYGDRSQYPDNLPYGLGPRVGLIAISPWSKGGFVCSQVFDHTSVIRFIERRFGVAEPNITPWRRAICGDLTAAFDFAAPKDGQAALPDTRDYLQRDFLTCDLPAPGVPPLSAAADIGAQEPGVRPARPLPYDLAVDEIAGDSGTLTLRLASNGAAAACFYVYRENTEEMPRRYTVGAGASLTDQWPLPGAGSHLFTVTGPNGFVRRFRRQAGGNGLLVGARHVADPGAVILRLTNPGAAAVSVQVKDAAYGQPLRTVSVPAAGSAEQTWALQESGHWYDLIIAVTDRPGEDTRLAGHVETGAQSMTDPAAVSPVLALDT
jgi:phospholipase C